ncbi:MAG: SH3 domain-containing protein [Firmicutes bacterium]|nr:SH3 domain-containing protein [Bacillota bacterium]
MKLRAVTVAVLVVSLAAFLPLPVRADSAFTIGSQKYRSGSETYTIDVAPQISSGRTLLPVRYLAESCGAEVDWDPRSQVVTLKANQTTIQLTIGSSRELVNGQAVEMDVAPVIIDGRTMLPARWVAENLGYQVAWNANSRTVTIFPKKAYVQVSAANVRQSPSQGSKLLSTLQQYTVLEVTDDVNGWFKVNLPGGGSGWVAGWLTTPASSRAPRLFEGTGVWTNIYKEPLNSGDLARFKNAGIRRIYLEVARSPQGFPPEWQGWIDSLLPLARQYDIEVVGWVVTYLEDPAGDARLVAQVSNYRTPLGDCLDAVAADIERLPQNDTAAAAGIVEQFARAVYPQLRPGCPLLAITYPPQQRPKYPFQAMSENFNGILLMDYWHTEERNYSREEAARFVSESVSILKRAGCKAPIEVILEGCDIGHGGITAAEMAGAVSGARSSGVNYSIYLFDPAPDVWQAFIAGS